MVDPLIASHRVAKGPSRVAALAYRSIDIADRLWRRWNRMLEKAVVAWDARRR